MPDYKNMSDKELDEELKRAKKKRNESKDRADSHKYVTNNKGVTYMKNSYRTKRLNEVSGPDRDKVAKQLKKEEQDYVDRLTRKKIRDSWKKLDKKKD